MWMLSRVGCFVILASLFASGSADAVWAHRPLCDAEANTSAQRKELMDGCIAKIDPAFEGGQAGVELPCSSELKALDEAQASLRRCLISQRSSKLNLGTKK